MMLFTGSANPELAQMIVQRLGLRLGCATVSRFSDGEISIEIDENVRGKDVFVIQSTCAPTNDNLMELILMIDALRRSSASGKCTRKRAPLVWVVSKLSEPPTAAGRL